MEVWNERKDMWSENKEGLVSCIKCFFLTGVKFGLTSSEYES